MLPQTVLDQVREELPNWEGTGVSVMETGHREPRFVAMAAAVRADLRRLAAIPDDYEILFLHGGARLHFAMVPLNLGGGGAARPGADYVNSGHWGAAAMREAARFIRVHSCATLAAERLPLALPPESEWRRNDDALYLHYTPNETISGLAFPAIPDSGATPLVADMSSSLLSAPLDIGRFGLIYSCAQKNLGIAGLALVIVRRDLIAAEPLAATPGVMHYRDQARDNSLINTPPMFAWYVAGLMVRWLLGQGGLAAVGERNHAKAAALYACIDDSGGFYRNHVHRDWRSIMNVTFLLHEPALERAFLEEAAAADLAGLAGHGSVGGLRASLYNAMPMSGVAQLVDFMREFRRRRG